MIMNENVESTIHRKCLVKLLAKTRLRPHQNSCSNLVETYSGPWKCYIDCCMCTVYVCDLIKMVKKFTVF